MKKLALLLSTITLIIFNVSCTKKDTSIDFFEVKCRNMKIRNPNAQMLGDSTWQSDSTCGDIPYMGTASISFDFNGEEDCLYKIMLDKVTFNGPNGKLAPVNYTEQLLKTDPKVHVEGGRITYTFCFLMASQKDWDDLNYITIKWHVENEIADWSNTLTVRINMPGKGPDPSTYHVVKTIHVQTKYITIKLWDHAAQDGDIVSVALNGNWIVNNHMLTKRGDYYTAQLYNGDNHLVVFAENEGTSGPNTCSISINGGHRIQLEPDLHTGSAINIVF